MKLDAIEAYCRFGTVNAKAAGMLFSFLVFFLAIVWQTNARLLPLLLENKNTWWIILFGGFYTNSPSAKWSSNMQMKTHIFWSHNYFKPWWSNRRKWKKKKMITVLIDIGQGTIRYHQFRWNQVRITRVVWWNYDGVLG